MTMAVPTLFDPGERWMYGVNTDFVTFQINEEPLPAGRPAGGRIAEIGHLAPTPGEEVLDASGLLVLPGLINAHQHLYQVGSTTRLRCGVSWARRAGVSATAIRGSWASL